MYLKYAVVYDEECTVGLRYDTVRGVAQMGGFDRWRINMETILRDGLGYEEDMPVPQRVQKNKIRYTWPLTSEGFGRLLRAMSRSGIAVRQVRSLHRIMI